MLRASLLADVCVLMGNAAAFEIQFLGKGKEVIPHLNNKKTHLWPGRWTMDGRVLHSILPDLFNSFYSLKWSGCKELKGISSVKAIISAQPHCIRGGGSAAFCIFIMAANHSQLLSLYLKFTNLEHVVRQHSPISCYLTFLKKDAETVKKFKYVMESLLFYFPSSWLLSAPFKREKESRTIYAYIYNIYIIYRCKIMLQQWVRTLLCI